jgi:predicted nucleotidyltransferase
MGSQEYIDIGNLVSSLFHGRSLSLDRIILFGSAARSAAKEDSDIDLIIVSKNFRDVGIFARCEMMKGLNRSLVRRFKIPFDTMYYSDLEWEQEESPLLDTVRREGKNIYPI